MKSLIKNSGMSQNKNYDDQEINEKIESITISGLNFKKPLLNNFTSEKDRKIFEVYGKDFYKFFTSGNCVNLPMFTEPPQPRAVKRIVVDKNFTIQAGNQFTIAVNPFDVYNGLVVNGTARQAFIQSETTSCFVFYQVVCAKIMIRQVGIMSLNDGYGTIIDAAVVNPITPVEWGTDNILSVQVGPGKKLMMIDGRTGIEAHFIGSPLYKKIYPSPASMDVETMYQSAQPIYLPANTRIIGPTDANVTVTLEDGTTATAQPLTPIFLPGVEVNSRVFASTPDGEMLIARISPPSINVSIKVYIDMVIEGITKPQESTNMQQITPPVFFDFNRLKYAIENFVPSLTEMGWESPQVAAKKRLIGYAADKKPIFKVTKMKSLLGRKRKRKKNKSEVEKEIQETFFDPGNPEHWDLICNKPEKEKWIFFDGKGDFSFGDALQEQEYKDYLKKNNIKPGFSMPEEVKKFFEGEPLKSKPQNPKVGKASDNPKIQKIMRKVKKKNIYNVEKEINLPDVIKRASKFLGCASTELRTVANNNRLFKDATTQFPSLGYQYFPLVVGDKAIPTCLGVKLGKHNDCKESVSYTVMNIEEKEKELNIYYCKTDFEKPEKFLEALQSIINFLYGYAFHAVPDHPISIKIFSDHKVDGTSYMYALLMAMYGAPSGGYFTGSFFCDENGQYTINEIPEDAFKKKIASATVECPLNVLDKEQGEGQYINIMAGVVPYYEEGQMIPTDDLRIAALYGMIPFKTRTVRVTPYSKYTPDDKQYVLQEFSDPYRIYIVAKNLRNPEKISAFLKDKYLKWKEFQRSDPDNFTTYNDDKKNYVTANEFYKNREDLLGQGNFWYFNYNGKLYVDRNKFKADVRTTQYRMIDKLTKEAKESLEKDNLEILKVTEDEANKARRALAVQKDDPNLLREKKEIKIQGGESEKENYLVKIENAMGPMAQVIANVREFIAKNPVIKQGKKKRVFYDDNSVQAAGLLHISIDVNPDVNVEDNKDIKEFKKFSQDSGAQGPFLIGHLMGLEDINVTPNPSLSVLRKIYSYLSKFNDEHEPVEPLDERSQEIANKYRSKIPKKISIKSLKKKQEKKKQIKKSDDEEDEKEVPVKSKVKPKDMDYDEEYSE